MLFFKVFFVVFFISTSSCFSINTEVILAYVCLPRNMNNEDFKVDFNGLVCFFVLNVKKGFSEFPFSVNEIDSLKKAKIFCADESLKECFRKKLITIKKEGDQYSPKSDKMQEGYAVEEMLCCLYPISEYGYITHKSIVNYGLPTVNDQLPETIQGNENDQLLGLPLDSGGNDMMTKKSAGDELVSTRGQGNFSGASLESITAYLSSKDEGSQLKEMVENFNGTYLVQPPKNYQGSAVQKLSNSMSNVMTISSMGKQSSSRVVSDGKVASFKFE